MSIMFDAVSIEYSFARFNGEPLGGRGEAWDADVFRNGNPQHLSNALNTIIENLEVKAKKLNFSDKELEAGGIGAQLNLAIERLNQYSIDLSKNSKPEPNDHHWLIISSFITIINTLFKLVEKNV